MINSKSISSIRLIAMSMIITCHIFQGENMVLAWWFNVGVQIFLFMSGFLYGTKNIENPISWIKKRFARIALPYYILVISVCLFYLVFARNLLSVNGIFINGLFLQGFATGLPGIEHLWFLSYILLCYLITPILQAVDISDHKNSVAIFFSKLLFLLLFLQILNYLTVINISVPNLGAYIIGYYFSRRFFYHAQADSLPTNKPLARTCTVIFTACILTTPLVIYLEYFYQEGLFSVLYPYKYILFACNHTLLGISLFLAMYFLFNRIYNRKEYNAVNHVLQFSDEYSYPIYITHQIFILGQFSLLSFTSYKALNIIIILACAFFTGIVLGNITPLVSKKIQSLRKLKSL